MEEDEEEDGYRLDGMTAEEREVVVEEEVGGGGGEKYEEEHKEEVENDKEGRRNRSWSIP